MTTQTKPTLKISLLYLGASIMILGSIQYFISKLAGIMIDKPIASELWYRMLLRTHIVCGLIAIFTGPTQILEYFRVKNLTLHKQLGYLYTFAVTVSGLAGLIISFYAMGGFVSKSGLFALSVTWLCTLAIGIRAVLNRKIEVHRYWLNINYGVTFAAVTQRFFLLFGQLMGIEFLDLYSFTNWASWMFNIGIVVWMMNSQNKKILELKMKS